MKASLKFKCAVIAVATTAFAMSAPAHAQFNNTNFNNSSNSGNQVLGALIGGVAGAALGDGIAPRGLSDEFGIAGGLLGGVAGAAIAGGNSNRQRGFQQYYRSGYRGYSSPYYGGGRTNLSINLGLGNSLFGNNRRFRNRSRFGNRGGIFIGGGNFGNRSGFRNRRVVRPRRTVRRRGY